MKTIGIIGGMSWKSSIEYYRIINEVTREKLGGLHSAKSVMVSVDFAPVEEMQKNGQWDEAADVMIHAANQVASGGADFIVIATNTMHQMYEAVQREVNIPILHIADATASWIKERDIDTIGLLGTISTMEMDFYKKRLAEKFNLTVLVPKKEDRLIVNQVIYEELVLGKIKPKSRNEYVRVMENLVEMGAEGIILGCTEISLLVGAHDTSVPVFDTTHIHAETAVEIALGIKNL
ncbi:MAG: aspartate/glutamate racemase family protein [Anaerolineaceae bacterium]|nr:aspartate/glutamate racemase family protein [Anaerolineaceae bacterium]